MSDDSLVWRIDEFCDRATRVKKTVVDKQNEFARKWGHKDAVTFMELADALKWMVERAQGRVSKKQDELAKEEARLRKCSKRYKDFLGGRDD